MKKAIGDDATLAEMLAFYRIAAECGQLPTDQRVAKPAQTIRCRKTRRAISRARFVSTFA